jgi:hypothetical protein
VKGSIILTQAGLEVLGWHRLVEGKPGLSGNGYEKLEATDKLRLLLMVCGIPPEIPASLPKLTALPKSPGNQEKDGPQVLTEVRNALVHSNPTKRQKGFDAIVHDVWALGLWYSELVILNPSLIHRLWR